MKTLGIALFLMFGVAVLGTPAEAQIHSTVISHVHATVRLTGTAVPNAGQSVPTAAPAGAHTLPFELTSLADSLTFPNDGADHQFVGHFSNLSDSVLHVSFRRFQNLPSGWSSSICFGSNCLAPMVDTPTRGVKPFEFQAHESQDFILHLYDSVGVPFLTRTTIYVRLTALTGDPADTMMLRMTGTSDPMAGVAASAGSAEEAISIFPNPLAAGQSLTLKLNAPDLGTPSSIASVKLFDASGRCVRSFPSIRKLVAGTNELHLGALDLPSGAYTLTVRSQAGVQFSRRFELVR